MPNEFSNFTQQDSSRPDDGVQGQPAGVPGDPGSNSHWDPDMFNPQTQRNGAWVPNTQQSAGNAGSPPPGPWTTFSPGAWGGTGNMVDANGNDIPGTSGAVQDVGRYRQMAQNPANATGPQIDRESSDASRGVSMGALGLLKDRAYGADTPAQALSRQQTAGAVSAINSSAAGVKGGAMAREAAARGAVAGGARVSAQGAQDTQALAAREQADAAGQYFGASSGQRGVDLGLATSQAGLDAGQRALNNSHEAFYEGLGQDVKASDLSHQLGRTASEDAAANASTAAGLQEQQAAWGNYKDAASVGIGGVTGGVSAYNKSNSPAPAADPNDPWDPSKYTGSDERMKQNVEPMRSRARIAAKTRELALSDPAAKQQAFLDGVDYAQHGHDTLGKAANVTHEYTRPDRRVPLPPTPRTVAPGGGATTFEVIKKPEMTPDKGTIKPVSPPAPAPKPKGKKHSEADPMQDANRSMVASSYEYKPGFTPSAQYEGETNVGPMANAMADDPVASTAIVRDPNSGLLAIDKEKGLKLTMGGLASLQHQVDDLKKRTA